MEEYRALGMMELKSIARGYEAADQLVKTADVEFVTAVTTCPRQVHHYHPGRHCGGARRAGSCGAIFCRLCGGYILAGKS